MSSMEYCSSKLLSCLYQNISCLWNEGELCDVVIKTADGQAVAAHRLLLSAFSPYFRVMFTCSLRESRQKVVEMKDISGDILAAIIMFAYSSKLEVNSDNVEGLLAASNLLQIKEIEKVCCDFLRTQLHPSNCLGVWTLAEHHCCRELSSYSFKYILKNFMSVCQSEEFCCLSLNEVKVLLNDENLAITSEEVVYEAALKWVQSENEREQYLPEILGCVRLPSLRPDYLNDTVLENKLLADNQLCWEMIQTALHYASSPLSEKQKISSISYKASRIHGGYGDKLLAIGGLHGGEAMDSVEKYDMYSETWQSVCEMPSSRYGVAVAKLHGLVYCLGGCTSGIFLDTCENYDAESDVWQSISHMSRPRKYLGAAQAHGRIFAVGGTDGFTKQKSVESFDPNKNEWRGCAPMEKSRIYVGMGSIDGLIYAVGGHDGVKRLSSVECFDVVTNHWSPVKSMAKARSVAGVVAMDNIMYCVGGFDGTSHLSDAYMYDPRIDKWMQIASMSFPRSASSLAAMKGRLYVLGGFNGQFLQSVEMFDPRCNSWETVADMPQTRVHFAASVV